MLLSLEKIKVTLTEKDGKVEYGKMPLKYWGDMKAEYEAHNKDYTGVFKD